MGKTKLFLFICISLFHFGWLSAQNEEREYAVRFRVNDTRIDPNFGNNRERIESLIDFLRAIQNDSTRRIVNIAFCGAASPEGSYQLNRWLANQRMEALEKIVRAQTDLSENSVWRDDSYIPWSYLRDCVSRSDLSCKDTVIAILDERPILVEYRGNRLIDHRIKKLWELENGKIWTRLFKNYFSEMRHASVRLTAIGPYDVSDCISTILPPPITNFIVSDREVAPVAFPALPIEPLPLLHCPRWERHLYVKTNLVGLAFLNANIAAEVDLAKHWSFTLPIYYSACNYFKSTIKFRTLSVQPEVRYWLSDLNDRWFVGAHMGVSYFNFAFDGAYRYQDHDGNTPALGGGLSLGYRLPVSKDERWKMEFSAGAGVYPVHYDRFHNPPGVKDGLLIDTKRDTYFGVDQVAISLAYTFNLKDGGRR